MLGMSPLSIEETASWMCFGDPTVDGRNPFRTTLKPWLKPLFVGIYVGGSKIILGFLNGGAKKPRNVGEPQRKYQQTMCQPWFPNGGAGHGFRNHPQYHKTKPFLLPATACGLAGSIRWLVSQEFWAAFPVKSPRPEVESEGAGYPRRGILRFFRGTPKNGGFSFWFPFKSSQKMGIFDKKDRLGVVVLFLLACLSQHVESCSSVS